MNTTIEVLLGAGEFALWVGMVYLAIYLVGLFRDHYVEIEVWANKKRQEALDKIESARVDSETDTDTETKE